MSDKFTRSGNVEGDIWYATTASSSKSLESLEDNIDNKMLAFIGQDSVGGSITSSVTETKIGEVIIPANSANTRFLIFASVTFNNGTTAAAATTMRIRTGTSATATSNTERESQELRQNAGAGGTGAGKIGASLIATISTSDEAFGSQIYVHVTGTNDVSDSNVTGTCNWILVIGA